MNIKYYVEDITNGQENRKIPLINTIDEDGLPPNFQYVSHSFLGTDTCSEDFNAAPQPCACTGSCEITSCSCATTYGFAFLDCHLKADFAISNSKPIIECSSLCTCDTKCPNRVTQFGISYKLKVYKTEKKGFGVQTLEKIPNSTYVCEYAGEIINENEAKRRFDLQEPIESNYIFVLREHCYKNTVITTIIDPTINGNIGRFLNHSCSPNLIMVPVRNENMVPKLCFFTTRDILPLEELCYDYGFVNNFQICNASTSKVSSPSSILKGCYCESVNCSSYLPYCADLL